MTQKEAQISRKILEWLSDQPGTFFWKQHQDMYSLKGIPDIIGVFRGRFVAIEVKQPSEQPTRLQEQRIRKLRESGALVIVAHSVAEAMEGIYTEFCFCNRCVDSALDESVNEIHE